MLSVFFPKKAGWLGLAFGEKQKGNAKIIKK